MDIHQVEQSKNKILTERLEKAKRMCQGRSDSHKKTWQFYEDNYTDSINGELNYDQYRDYEELLKYIKKEEIKLEQISSIEEKNKLLEDMLYTANSINNRARKRHYNEYKAYGNNGGYVILKNEKEF